MHARSSPVALVGTMCSDRLTYEGVQSGDPDVGLVRTRRHQVQGIELLAVYYGEGTFFAVRTAELLVAKDGGVLSGADLLDGVDGHWKGRPPN